MLGMFYLSCLRLSASLRLSPRLSRLSRLFVSSSFRVSPISLRFSRLFVCSSLSSFRLSPLFASLISPSLPLVPVDRSLPSPWLGYSHLHGSATPVSVLLSKSLLKTTTYILKRND